MNIIILDIGKKLKELLVSNWAPIVKQYKSLGPVIDEKLNGVARYNHITQILSHRKQLFFKIRFFLDQKTAVSLFKTNIQPIFDYKDFLYIMLNQEKLDKLQTLQNRFLRIVYYGMDMTSDEMCQNMGKGKLKERRDLHLCVFMYRRSKCEEYIDDRKLPSRQFDKMVMKVPELALTKSFDIPGFKGSKL